MSAKNAKKMRKIIKIDEEKCNGCGLCATACHEGAIVIEDGKAKLVSESYCDGLGDCIGECPEGAISFEEREAEDYDAAAVAARMKGAQAHETATLPCGCPGSMARTLEAAHPAKDTSPCAADAHPRGLRNWPVQLALVPVGAPYLKNARLLIAADCTAFASPRFHEELLEDRICVIACPKLDETDAYSEKLARIIRENGIRSIDIAYMEVPCCGGLLRIVEEAVDKAHVPVPRRRVKIALDGSILECEWLGE